MKRLFSHLIPRTAHRAPRTSPILPLAKNLLVVYLLYTLCRLVFLLTNWGFYAETMTWRHALHLFAAGLIFDTSAILYTNVLVIVAFLLPLHWKERPSYYNMVKWIYRHLCQPHGLCLLPLHGQAYHCVGVC